MLPYQRVLAATDFSAYGDAAIGRAAWIAGLSRSHLVVAHVISDLQEAVSKTSYRSRIEFMEGHDEAFQRELRRVSDDRLKSAIRALRPIAVEVHYETLLGRPYVELIHTVQREQYDLLVIGAGRHTTLRQLLIGSTAKRLVHACPAPVWVVKNDSPKNITAVLVAVDLSPVSRRALQQAKWIARHAQARLHVLHVVDCPELLSEFLQMKPGKGQYGTLRELIDAEAHRAFDEFLSEDIDQVVPIERHLCWGNSSQEILGTAKKLNVDLVTLGSVGRSGFQGLLLGNTAENVLTHCECDVLAIKPQEFVSPVDPATWQLHPGPQ